MNETSHFFWSANAISEDLINFMRPIPYNKNELQASIENRIYTCMMFLILTHPFIFSFLQMTCKHYIWFMNLKEGEKLKREEKNIEKSRTIIMSILIGKTKPASKHIIMRFIDVDSGLSCLHREECHVWRYRQLAQNIPHHLQACIFSFRNSLFFFAMQWVYLAHEFWTIYVRFSLYRLRIKLSSMRKHKEIEKIDESGVIVYIYSNVK